MPNVYLISGLGANEKAFRRIKLPENYNIHYLNWIIPELNESLKNYSIRLSEKIDKTKPFILIGVSFGGMVALEINKIFKAEKVILISSVKNREELPFWINNKLSKFLAKNIPTYFFKSTKKTLAISSILLTGRRHSKFIEEYFTFLNPKFIKWGVKQISHFNNITISPNTIHIHGSKDRIFPPKNIEKFIQVEKATHAMILTHGSNLNKVLNKHLQIIISE